ncbi:PIG-L family deacetylase [Geodermatophilus sp. YIM 151500]|uniref:PIG-L deacetylase family protein n=1 Tax=Geodermatophilus sp. YIM 151500 TaxID=2984531 RepID=UPI0021E4CEAD|nr:PIG-L family deacetylase [Geodermatophilus sp. YIM 151500]MCV2491385.1 PIG-L family deacetylase [Geodermatophilus sp. YIM 151500]
MTARPHPAPGGPTAAPGTPEPAWRAWLAAAALPELVLADQWTDVLVCAAHPDDDVLAVGGLLVALSRRGARLHLLCATDGEGSHPGSRVLAPAELARRRVAESAAAVRALSLHPASTTRLGLPDAGLARAEAALTRVLAGTLAELPAAAPTRAGTGSAAGAAVHGPPTPGLVLAPWRGDAHPDHEALGRAASAAAAAHGAALLEYPVWAWTWAVPGDPRVPWHRARRVPLHPELRARKRRAVGRFTTQVRPLGPAAEDAAVLEPSVLAHFDRDPEVVLG